MIDPALPPDLGSTIRDLERRIRDLETSPRLVSASMKGGRLRILGPSGEPLVTMGEVSPGTYGFLVQNTNGRTIFRAGTDGNNLPPTPIVLQVNGGASVDGTAMRPATTSATYTELWRGEFYTTGPDLFHSVVLYPNTSTLDWRLRVYELNGGTPTTLAETTGVTANAYADGWNTIPASCLAPGTGTDPVGRWMTVRLEARRSAGAGNVAVALAGTWYIWETP